MPRIWGGQDSSGELTDHVVYSVTDHVGVVRYMGDGKPNNLGARFKVPEWGGFCPNNLWARFKAPEWGVFCHTARL